MASLLELVQDAADRIGITRPTSVIGSSDPGARMLLQCAQAEGRELARRHAWQGLTFEKTFVSVASESQTDALPSDFDRIVQDTFWNRTQQWPIGGPMTPQDYADLVARGVNPMHSVFRIRGNAILLAPAPAAGETMAYEYVSKFWAGTSGSITPTLAAFSGDTDIPYLDDEIMRLGIVWRYKKGKGFEYGEDFNSYEMAVAQLSGRDGGRKILRMGEQRVFRPRAPEPPDGNWNIS